MGTENHPTVKPPTLYEQERRKHNVALERLRTLDEDWEFLSDFEKRDRVKNIKDILE